MRVNGIIQGLRDVATFLNDVGMKTTQAQWNASLKKIRSYWVGSSLSADWTTHASRRMPEVQRMRLEEAQELRRLIDGDLEFLRSDVPLDRPFYALVERLNNLELKMAWHCEPLGPKAKPHDPSQAILKMHLDNGVMERWMVQAWPVTRTLKDTIYAILGKALESGALNRLRVCRECGKYLVVADLKRRFCEASTKCHDDYHNRETHAENRKYRREQAISQADQLVKAGKSKDEIRDKTGLPQRTVEQIFDGQLPSLNVVNTRPAARIETASEREHRRTKLLALIAAEAQKDKVYMEGIRAQRKRSADVSLPRRRRNAKD